MGVPSSGVNLQWGGCPESLRARSYLTLSTWGPAARRAGRPGQRAPRLEALPCWTEGGRQRKLGLRKQVLKGPKVRALGAVLAVTRHLLTLSVLSGGVGDGVRGPHTCLALYSVDGGLTRRKEIRRKQDVWKRTARGTGSAVPFAWG